MSTATEQVAVLEVVPPRRSAFAPKRESAPKLPKAPKPPRPPRPPRRPPPSALPPLAPRAALARALLTIVLTVLLGFAINLLVLSHLQHSISQQNLTNDFRVKLAEGTAPVSEGDFEDKLVADGEPVALVEIPSIGVSEVVVEGTSSTDLKKGPGHRRDTVLPGQAGVSVIMGRKAAYGGPFARLQELAPGETIRVVTGQGEHLYAVLGLRYAGDPAPPPPKAGEGRLILQTARGGPYMPTGTIWVDAQLKSEVKDPGRRQTTAASLSPADRPLATDTGTVYLLIFALQFLLLTEAAAVWAFLRLGRQKTWVVFAPVLLLAGLLVADQVAPLLPNLL